MQKQCPCGQDMRLKLRTVIFSGKLEIDNVPIYSCDACLHSELKASIKTELKEIIEDLGKVEKKHSVRFNEINEWADFLVSYKLKHKNNQTSKQIFDSMLKERINDLLDLHLIAQNLNDTEWIDSIQKRLVQLSSY